MKRQRGIALITAVLVVSIAVIAATAVLDAGHYAIQRAATLQDSEKAWGYAAGAEDWVRTILQRDAEDNRHDSLDEIWAQPQTLPIENGALGGAIEDALGRFNLNNLGLADNEAPRARSGDGAQDTAFQQQARIFARLVDNLEGGSTLIPDPMLIAQAVRDWIDPDSFPTGSGREDSDYLILNPPRRTANRAMASVTELRVVLDALFDPRSDDARKVYALLLPHVTALPVNGVTPINVNTATPELLAALSDKGLSNGKLAQFIAERQTRPLKDAGDITSDLEFSAADADPRLVTVSSSLFRLRVTAAVGQGRVALYSLIFRPQRGLPVVLQRSTDTE